MVDSPYPYSLTLPQTDTEAILTARLEELGGGVERGVALESFEQDDDGVHGAAGRRRGRSTAPYVVGADGSHSTVREQMGLKLEGSFKGQTFVIADVEAEYDHPPESMHTFLRRGRDVPAVPACAAAASASSPRPRRARPRPRWRACRPWPTRARAASG